MFGRFFRSSRKTQFSYTCATCGETHSDLPALGQGLPPSYFDVPEEFREGFTRTSDDLCRIDSYPGADFEGSHYFVRGTFDIPIVGHVDTVSLGLWFSQSEASFETYVATFQSDQTSFGAFAWAQPDSTYFRDFEPGVGLISTPCDLFGNVAGQRPFGVAHDDADTRIARLQRDGIDQEEVKAIMSAVLHPENP